MSSKKRYANVANPTIEAIVNELFRFNRAQALAQLESLKENFILSKQQNTQLKKPSITLWIKGFALAEREKKMGFTGHFALVTYKALGEGKYTLTARKQPMDIKFHPQKQRPKQRHPDWGHPILRNIKKRKVYETLEQAQEVLEKMHTQYPETSIPVRNGLHIMIYSKAEKGKPPVQKYILLIKADKEGGFYLECEEKQPRTKLPPKLQEDKEKVGYFTSMVELKKRKKR